MRLQSPRFLFKKVDCKVYLLKKDKKTLVSDWLTISVHRLQSPLNSGILTIEAPPQLNRWPHQTSKSRTSGDDSKRAFSFQSPFCKNYAQPLYPLFRGTRKSSIWIFRQFFIIDKFRQVDVFRRIDIFRVKDSLPKFRFFGK